MNKFYIADINSQPVLFLRTDDGTQSFYLEDAPILLNEQAEKIAALQVENIELNGRIGYLETVLGNIKRLNDQIDDWLPSDVRSEGGE